MPSVDGRNEFRQESERIAAEIARQAVETLHRGNAESQFPPEPPGLGAVGGIKSESLAVELLVKKSESLAVELLVRKSVAFALLKMAESIVVANIEKIFTALPYRFDKDRAIVTIAPALADDLFVEGETTMIATIIAVAILAITIVKDVSQIMAIELLLVIVGHLIEAELQPQIDDGALLAIIAAGMIALTYRSPVASRRYDLGDRESPPEDRREPVPRRVSKRQIGEIDLHPDKSEREQIDILATALMMSFDFGESDCMADADIISRCRLHRLSDLAWIADDELNNHVMTSDDSLYLRSIVRGIVAKIKQERLRSNFEKDQSSSSIIDREAIIGLKESIKAMAASHEKKDRKKSDGINRRDEALIKKWGLKVEIQPPAREFDIDALISVPCVEIVTEIQLLGIKHAKAKAKAVAKPGRKQICFNRDPSRSGICSLGSKCSRDHLDTTVAESLARYDAAKSKGHDPLVYSELIGDKRTGSINRPAQVAVNRPLASSASSSAPIIFHPEPTAIKGGLPTVIDKQSALASLIPVSGNESRGSSDGFVGPSSCPSTSTSSSRSASPERRDPVLDVIIPPDSASFEAVSEAHQSHLKMAKGRSEDIAAPTTPDKSIVRCVDRISALGIEGLITHRRRHLYDLRRMSIELRPESDLLLSAAPEHVRNVLGSAGVLGSHPALLKWCLEEIQRPDLDLVEDLLRGFPLHRRTSHRPEGHFQEGSSTDLLETDAIADTEMLAMTVIDAKLKRMSQPRLFDKTRDRFLTRRFVVRQRDAKGRINQASKVSLAWWVYRLSHLEPSVAPIVGSRIGLRIGSCCFSFALSLRPVVIMARTVEFSIRAASPFLRELSQLAGGPCVSTKIIEITHNRATLLAELPESAVGRLIQESEHLRLPLQKAIRAARSSVGVSQDPRRFLPSSSFVLLEFTDLEWTKETSLEVDFDRSCQETSLEVDFDRSQQQHNRTSDINSLFRSNCRPISTIAPLRKPRRRIDKMGASSSMSEPDVIGFHLAQIGILGGIIPTVARGGYQVGSCWVSMLRCMAEKSEHQSTPYRRLTSLGDQTLAFAGKDLLCGIGCFDSIAPAILVLGRLDMSPLIMSRFTGVERIHGEERRYVARLEALSEPPESYFAGSMNMYLEVANSDLEPRSGFGLNSLFDTPTRVIQQLRRLFQSVFAPDRAFAVRRSIGWVDFLWLIVLSGPIFSGVSPRGDSCVGGEVDRCPWNTSITIGESWMACWWLSVGPSMVGQLLDTDLMSCLDGGSAQVVRRLAGSIDEVVTSSAGSLRNARITAVLGGGRPAPVRHPIPLLIEDGSSPPVDLSLSLLKLFIAHAREVKKVSPDGSESQRLQGVGFPMSTPEIRNRMAMFTSADHQRWGSPDIIAALNGGTFSAIRRPVPVVIRSELIMPAAVGPRSPPAGPPPFAPLGARGSGSARLASLAGPVSIILRIAAWLIRVGSPSSFSIAQISAGLAPLAGPVTNFFEHRGQLCRILFLSLCPLISELNRSLAHSSWLSLIFFQHRTDQCRFYRHNRPPFFAQFESRVESQLSRADFILPSNSNLFDLSLDASLDLHLYFGYADVAVHLNSCSAPSRVSSCPICGGSGRAVSVPYLWWSVSGALLGPVGIDTGLTSHDLYGRRQVSVGPPRRWSVSGALLGPVGIDTGLTSHDLYGRRQVSVGPKHAMPHAYLILDAMRSLLGGWASAMATVEARRRKISDTLARSTWSENPGRAGGSRTQEAFPKKALGARAAVAFTLLVLSCCGEATVDDWKAHPRLQKHLQRFLDNPDPGRVLSRYSAQAQNLDRAKLLRIAVHVGAWVALLPLKQAAASPSGEEENVSQPSPVQLLAGILRLRGRAKISDWSPLEQIEPAGPIAAVDTESPMVQQFGSLASEVLLASDCHLEISKLGSAKAARRFHCDGTAFSSANLAERALHASVWNCVVSSSLSDRQIFRFKAALNEAAAPMPEDAQERLQANLQSQLRKLICKGLSYLDLSDAGTASQLAAKQWLRLQGILTADATTQAEANLQSSPIEDSCRCDAALLTKGKAKLMREEQGTSKGGVYVPNVTIQSNPLVRNTGQDVILACNKCGLELRSSWVFEYRGKVSTVVPCKGHLTCGGKYVHADAKIRVKLDISSNLNICPHGNLTNKCVRCGGSQVCAHKKRRDRCPHCPADGYKKQRQAEMRAAEKTCVCGTQGFERATHRASNRRRHQSSPAERLRSLLQTRKGILTMLRSQRSVSAEVRPCAYDALTARLVERQEEQTEWFIFRATSETVQGFEITFMTGFGVSAALRPCVLLMAIRTANSSPTRQSNSRSVAGSVLRVLDWGLNFDFITCWSKMAGHGAAACKKRFSFKVPQVTEFFHYKEGYEVESNFKSWLRCPKCPAKYSSSWYVDQAALVMETQARALVGPAPFGMGYGNAVNVKRTVRGYAQAGMAAIMIEAESLTRKRDPLAREECIADATEGLAEAIARCKAFVEAGADITFLEAPLSEDEMERYCREVPGPKLVNMLPSGKTPMLSLGRLEEMGFALAAYPLTLLSAGLKAQEEALTRLRDGKTTWDLELDFETLKDVVGFTDYYKEEDRYKT
ncbi:unnamed protein product [Polarella glacialis]|uniref:Uncharacterized protein n=1 Tax=Polarella glacialis TaxID=89957 RepID=A0A813HDC5_POLGL|nr:unnamed protein product [Polarella glacialis]